MAIFFIVLSSCVRPAIREMVGEQDEFGVSDWRYTRSVLPRREGRPEHPTGLWRLLP